MSRLRDAAIVVTVLAALAVLAPGVLERTSTDLRQATASAANELGVGGEELGWREVRTGLSLTGQMANTGFLALVAEQGEHQCLLEVSPEVPQPTCTTAIPEGKVTALAGETGWPLAATSGSRTQVWQGDESAGGGAGAPTTVATPLAASVPLPRGTVLGAIALDDDVTSPLLVGVVPDDGSQVLRTWTFGQKLEQLPPPGGAACCELAPGGAIVASGGDPVVFFAAATRPVGSSGAYGVRAWFGVAETEVPQESWQWDEEQLPTPMDRVTDAKGWALNTWLAGTSGSRPVLTSFPFSGPVATIPLPELELDPRNPVVLLPAAPLDNDGLLVAVQTVKGPVVLVRSEQGWSQLPVPAGQLIDAENDDGTTWLTIRDKDGIHLWSRRLG